MRIAPLSDALGVELLDFDITRPCDAQERAELRRLFLAHHLVLVRGQDLCDADHNRFAESFGPLSLMGDASNAGYVTNRDGRLFGPGMERLLWHSDGTYGLQPGIATSLWAQEVTPESAPTMFANAARALEKLPTSLRARIETLHAVHLRDTKMEQTAYRFREEDIPRDAVPGRIRRQEHPIVYQPPHTGAKVLLVNELLTSHVSDLPRDEGEALLEELFARIYAEDNVYTHWWQTRDVVLWDNIVLQHCRPREVGSEPRHLRRLSLDGWITERGVLDWVATGGARERIDVAR